MRRRSPLKLIRHAVAYALLRGAFGALALLPERMIFTIGELFGWLLTKTPLYRTALTNVRAAFGDQPPSPEFPTAEALARASLRHYGLMFAEWVMLDRWQQGIAGRFEYDPFLDELAKEALSATIAPVVASGHIGNWEVFGRGLAAKGFKVSSVASTAFDPRIETWLKQWRTRGGVTVITRGSMEASRQIRNQMRQGWGLGLMSDVDTTARSVWVPFFGKPAKTPAAAAEIALKYGAPLVVAWSWRIAPGRYGANAVRVSVEPTGDRQADTARLTAELTRLLEVAIRAHPEQWIWTHRRWKSAPPATTGEQKQLSTAA